MNPLCEIIKLSSLRDAMVEELTKIIKGPKSTESDTKVIYASPNIHSTLGTIFPTEETLHSGLGVLGIFPLGVEADIVEADRGVFLVNADIESLRKLEGTLLKFAETNPNAPLHTLFVPKKTVMIEEIMENSFQSLLSNPKLQIEEFDWDAFPLDDDVVSLELPLSFRQLVGDGDPTVLFLCARMVLKLQTSFFGSIPIVRGRGAHAAKVVHMLKRMRSEIGSDSFVAVAPKIESLLILDRSVDLLTPSLTQMTYEGIIDEFFSISSGGVTLSFDVGEGSNLCTGQRIHLSNDDKVFKEIRDKNYTHVGSVLHNKSVWIKQCYDKRKELQQLKELKDFMKGLPEMQEMHRLIGVHTAIATEIGKRTQTIDFRRRIVIEHYILQQTNEREVFEYIEELANDSAPMEDVLRLLSLYSVINGGLKDKFYDHFKRVLLLSYGIPFAMATLMCLERCGLITKYDTKHSNYSSLQKQFKLWTSELQNQQQNDLALPYGGYVPLSVRLLEKVITHPESWSTPGSMGESSPDEKVEIRYNEETPEGPPVTMFLLIGGITRAEISAIRLLQSKLADAGNPRRIVVATTSIVNGATVITSALPYPLEE
ncbi:vacuolar sorting protein 33, putative [Trypanosoma equiperdum]|uniref:Vacuolar protein sorting 33, putative n=2 Tax=Trypanozoon TaxID=39700 RepID=Q582U1_TRYB2|nr:vacuolar protein sorting 33, putative [Trypanosoma brucei brucei TREU927]AAX80691.1 vacuolar protein sorting 33, putative [Trypanosoma brucei]AAZ10263.1 vacuolar protein sorting 33, putative [Trypanosoma brucei brucei TREU927]SCU70644.1 vacuolar sorting protein 33, putative [Trypanosoma equiperdum]